MSNPWVRGEGGERPPDPAPSSGPHPGGMQPPRRPSSGRAGRSGGPGGPGGPRRPGGSGGGPPLWLIAAIGAVVVLLVGTLIVVKLVGRDDAVAAPPPTSSTGTAGTAGSSAPPSAPASSPSSAPASTNSGGTVPPTGRNGQPSASPFPGQPSNAVAVPAARGWVVVEPQWGVSKVALADEQRAGDVGSREWTYPATDSAPQAFYWVRARNGVSAENLVSDVYNNYAPKYPGTQTATNQAFSCPRQDRVSGCWRISYVVPASASAAAQVGILSAYQRTNGITVLTDFRALAANAPAAQAGADRMTASLIASF